MRVTIRFMEHKVVKKSNALIEASYKLTAQEQWIVLFLTSLIKSQDEDFKSYSISIKDFSELAGIRHKGEYKEVEEITKKLIGRVFTINEPSGPLQVSWLSSAKYLTGQGTVTLKFDPNLKPYLLQLKDRFTRYNLTHVMQLKSSYSIRIYELLKQYQGLKERSILVDDLRDKLGLGPDDYPRYANFKQKVLNVAQKEISEKTDISFDYEEIKMGRSVGKIRFLIRSQNKVQQTIPFTDAITVSEVNDKAPSVENLEMIKLMELVPQPFRKDSVRKIIQSAYDKHGFNFVIRNIEFANQRSNAVKPGSTPDKGSNYRNYLAKALQGDFGLAYREDREAIEELRRKQQEEADAALAAVRQERERVVRDQENAERARVFRDNLPPEALELLRQEALANLDEAHRALVLRKAPGSEMILKIEMDKICIDRMNLT